MFELPVRVYIEDTDAGGIVYHSNYLKFMERARTEFLRGHGYQHTETEKAGAIFVVTELSIRYFKPALMDDELTVTLSLKSHKRASAVFDQQVLRGETLLCQAQITIASIDPVSKRPRTMPEHILQSLLSG
ncbi:tol-pal system-associated acyl-CoA thioesterase [Salinibius halmophilus]|uniref:tol-pal system-associated acyl-CoA thioesterase n=1 Tax=Salinibius halmophilus TaxID=1853216 RepID=UPI000E665EE8|nr:tol-pal system-associated acyl-CoA thioesterase [Salinibius halmophilus]